MSEETIIRGAQSLVFCMKRELDEAIRRAELAEGKLSALKEFSDKNFANLKAMDAQLADVNRDLERMTKDRDEWRIAFAKLSYDTRDCCKTKGTQ